MATRTLRPQEGPQTAFLASSASVTIYGGAAGGGKTYAELLAPLRYKDVKGFNYTIFRREYKQIFNAGALWDEAMEMYSGIRRAVPKYTTGQWLFRDKKGSVVSKITFAHIENDLAVHTYQGSQLCGIAFDELTHFTEKQFFYMLTRNRSTCGVPPFVLATTNPDADSWVAEFISWWIDQETGYAIPERSGVIRWMVRIDDKVRWGDSREELIETYHLTTKEELAMIKSVTFIASSIYDNKALLKSDPSYLGNLMMQPEVERERLLKGNWKIKAAAGLYFKRSQVTMVDEDPLMMREIVLTCRAWDLAATEDDAAKDPDYTSGVLMGRFKSGEVIVLDVINQRVKAGEVEKLIYNTTVADAQKYGFAYRVRIPQDPGAAGKIVANSYVQKLSGYSVITERVTGGKVNRATPFAAQWQNGHVKVLKGEWNDMYFKQLESFPESKHDDMVDGSSDSFNELSKPLFDPSNLI